MNPASQWRLSIAKKVASIYTENHNVAAVMVSGSAARGHADRFSDTEIGVFWHQPPAESERAQVIKQSGADLIRIYPFIEAEQVWCDDFMIGRQVPDQPESGLLVEVAHHTVDFMEATLQAVLQRHDPDERKQNLIAGVTDGIPISGGSSKPGPDLLTKWKKQAAAYPRQLSLAVINRHAQIDHFWRWQMWLARGDNRMMLYETFAAVEQKLLHVLLGLNRQYYSGFKWLDLITERLEIKPKNLTQRLKRVYHEQPAAGAQLIAGLVEETYNLVESHLPEVDTDWLRHVFRYQRPVLDRPPITNFFERPTL